MSTLRPLHEFHAGDIIGFSGSALSSVFINLGTYGIPFWDLSHVGMVAEHDGRLVLFESVSDDTEPCVVRGVNVHGSLAHELQSTIYRYKGKVWHYPLYRTLYDFESRRLSQFLLATLGISYDKIGAFRAAGVGFSWMESLLREADLSSLFCSEWCCAAHTEIGIFQTDHVSRYSPNRFVRTERRQGILLKPWRLK